MKKVTIDFFVDQEIDFDSYEVEELINQSGYLVTCEGKQDGALIIAKHVCNDNTVILQKAPEVLDTN